MTAYDLNSLKLLLETADRQPELAAPASTAFQTGMPLRDYLNAWAANPAQFPADTLQIFRLGPRLLISGSPDLLNAIEGMRDLTMLPIAAVAIEPGEAELIELPLDQAAVIVRQVAAKAE